MVFIYHGSASGIGAVVTKTLEINSNNANFGAGLNAAGDINKPTIKAA